MTTTTQRAMIGRHGGNLGKGEQGKWELRENQRNITSKCTSAIPLGAILFCNKDLQGDRPGWLD